MDVYCDGNFWGHDERLDNEPLMKVSVNQDFVWEDLEGFIPAIYVGASGVVMDLCIRVPIEKVEAFLEKWNQDERLSELTHEEYEQMERENPFSLEFQALLSLDGVELVRRQVCATGWHPLRTEQECVEVEAEELRKEYGCNPKSGWNFVRCAYGWPEGVKYEADSPVSRKIKVTLQMMKTPITAGYFTTGDSVVPEEVCEKRENGSGSGSESAVLEECKGREIFVVHPVSGKEYRMILQGCEQVQLDQDAFGRQQEGVEYPTCYQVLAYQVVEEFSEEKLSSEEFRIQDCADSDRPRKNGKGDKRGAFGFFVAGKRAKPSMHTAVSSLHFEPVTEVLWRVIFDVEERKPVEINGECFF